MTGASVYEATNNQRRLDPRRKKQECEMSPLVFVPRLCFYLEERPRRAIRDKRES